MTATTDTNPTIEVGAIVLPADGSYNGERIVGMVTGNEHAWGEMVDVVWVSDQRGVFWCLESAADLTVASLVNRAEIAAANEVGEGDLLIDHKALAALLAPLVP